MRAVCTRSGLPLWWFAVPGRGRFCSPGSGCRIAPTGGPVFRASDFSGSVRPFLGCPKCPDPLPFLGGRECRDGRRFWAAGFSQVKFPRPASLRSPGFPAAPGLPDPVRPDLLPLSFRAADMAGYSARLCEGLRPLFRVLGMLGYPRPFVRDLCPACGIYARLFLGVPISPDTSRPFLGLGYLGISAPFFRVSEMSDIYTPCRIHARPVVAALFWGCRFCRIFCPASYCGRLFMAADIAGSLPGFSLLAQLIGRAALFRACDFCI